MEGFQMRTISEKMSDLLKGLDELGYGEEYNQADNFDKFIELMTLRKEIFGEFVWNPGRVIKADNSEHAEHIRSMLSKFWLSLAEEEKIFDEMLSGGFDGILANIIGEYVERLKMVKPMVVCISPGDYHFDSFYSEAINAWLSGAGRAAVGLCGSILEEVLFTELSKIDREIALTFNVKGNSIASIQSLTLDKLITLAKKKGLISNQDADIAHSIRLLRNDILHEMKGTDDQETLEALDNTRKVIEAVLSGSNYY
jgi:hypothetical protein